MPRLHENQSSSARYLNYRSELASEVCGLVELLLDRLGGPRGGLSLFSMQPQTQP